MQTSPARSLALSALLAACGAAKAKDPCAGVTGTCVAFTPDQTGSTIQNAIAGAKDGTTLAFAEGTFSFTNEITLAAKGLTVQGAGREATTLDFHGQLAGSEGVLVSGSSFTMVDIGVKDALGNGVKVVGATGVTLRRMKAFYTNPDKSKHGGYAIYPVQCHQVLIEGSFASGATDTGIYVGQSEQVVIRNNEATQNVAGIEIENTHFADVHDNNAHDNSAGILIFALPGLTQKDTHDVRVYANQSVNNNVPNFAPAGGIIGNVPRGTGMFVMASHDVEIFGNTLSGNKTVSLAVINFKLAGIPYDDPGYYPYPKSVYLHDNAISNGGTDPDSTLALGQLFAAAAPRFPGMHIPDLAYDGWVDPAVTGTRAGNPMDLCVGASATSFVNFHGDHPLGAFGMASTDVTPYACTLPALAAVSFTGL